MAWSIRFDDRGQVPFIELTVTGALDADQLAAAFTAAHDLAEERGVWMILSDSVDQVAGPGAASLAAVAVRIGEIGFGSRYRQAIVLPRDTAAAVESRQWEAHACGQGLAVRTFHDRVDAIAWLTFDH